MSTRLTVYMDPYGRFFLSERRGGYPVTVELTDGYRVVEDPSGNRMLVGHEKSWSEVTDALRLGIARFV